MYGRLKDVYLQVWKICLHADCGYDRNERVNIGRCRNLLQVEGCVHKWVGAGHERVNIGRCRECMAG